MADQTYTIRGLVIKKTKLGESDQIVTLLSSEGALCKAVAKGARKPNNTFATRLELFCESELLIVKGKSLDIVKEVRLVDAHVKLRNSFERSVGAEVLCELLTKTAQEDLSVSRIYDLSSVALSNLETCPEDCLLQLTAAFIFKIAAILGFRPHFLKCAVCGKSLEFAESESSFSHSHYSVSDGGFLCDACAANLATRYIDCESLKFCEYLLLSTFSDICSSKLDSEAVRSCVHLAEEWIVLSMGIRLKSLTTLLTLF